MPDSPEVHQNFNATVYGVAGKAALEEFLDNPYLNVTMALIEGWKTAE